MLAADAAQTDDEAALITLGLHHEQQHQELLLTDILHLFAQNPLRPPMPRRCRPGGRRPAPGARVDRRLRAASSPSATRRRFAFDCEGPRHQVLLRMLCSHPVSNHQWFEFIEDGGYQSAGLWLSDGWRWVCDNQIEAPLYWEEREGTWWQMSLRGMQPVDPDSPVTHQLLEADAFARWAGRLPTEAEWEHAAQVCRPPAISSKAARCDRCRIARTHRASCARCSATYGNGQAAPSCPIPASTQRRRRGRIQRQVHEQPDGIARRLLRGRIAHPRQLSQFLLSPSALAVHRPQIGRRRVTRQQQAGCAAPEFPNSPDKSFFSLKARHFEPLPPAEEAQVFRPSHGS
jgi:hypothetical protein